MLEIREIFKTIQKYYGLFMNKCDENSSYSRHTERKRKYPVTNTKELSCNKSSYLEKNNQLDCFGSKEPHNDNTNSVILSGAKDPLKTDTNNAILRGLNNCFPQNDRKNICRLMRGDVRKTIRKAAFTLAEVLITLGIIGVVAALTLPTLIQNHQKQVYVTQLKKAYSTINNAFNKMAADEGVVDWNQTYCGEFHYELECYKRLGKQLNILNFKEPGEPCNADWCKTSAFQGWGDFITGGVLFTTSDGVLYIFACGSVRELVVDINGAIKGPNLRGRDIFEFYIETDKSKITPLGRDSYAWQNCSATNLSTDCTAKVLIEGKMNY